MPHALRISAEMLMLDCVGTSPTFSGGGGGAGVAVVVTAAVVGAFGGGVLSEPQPATTAVERNRIAATVFMIASLNSAALSRRAGLVYLVPRISGPRENPNVGRSGN